MKTPRLNLLLVAGIVLVMTGCMFLRPVPSDLGPIKLTPVSSASVEVQSFWIEHEKDRNGFVLRGYVGRRPNAVTTAHTQLHVRFLDAKGSSLGEENVGFEPNEIKDWKVRGEPNPYAKYSLSFKKTPQGTTEIEGRRNRSGALAAAPAPPARGN